MTLGWRDAETEPGRSASDRRAREAKGAALRAKTPTQFLRWYRNCTKRRKPAKVAADHGLTAGELAALYERALRSERR